MDTLRISLVTTCLNAGATIERTITSVLGQRHPRLDYIVMDGGSNDTTAELLRRYRRFFAHLDVVPGESRSALAARGFARAEGDIMAWVDDDVTLAPLTLDFVSWFFHHHPSIDVIYSHRLTIDGDDRAIGYEILPAFTPKQIRRYPLVPLETCFWRRSLYERCGGIDPRFSAAAGYDLLVRLLERGRARRVDRFLTARRGASAENAELSQKFDEEVRHIQTVHGLTHHPLQRTREAKLRDAMVTRGLLFAEDRTCRPGCLPGLGWSYDRLWGGDVARPEGKRCLATSRIKVALSSATSVEPPILEASPLTFEP